MNAYFSIPQINSLSLSLSLKQSNTRSKRIQVGFILKIIEKNENCILYKYILVARKSFDFSKKIKIISCLDVILFQFVLHSFLGEIPQKCLVMFNVSRLQILRVQIESTAQIAIECRNASRTCLFFFFRKKTSQLI